MSMSMRIGFLGLGIMGVPMALNVVKAGFPLTVYNRTPGHEGVLVEAGASVASSPADLASNVDVVVAMVTGPEALDNLLWGEGGAASGLGEGKVFVNMSSVSPRYTRELACAIAGTGAIFVDAPVSGSKKPAEDATLVILAGGPEETVKDLEPLLLSMGKKVIYCGEAGQGSMMKMTINLLLGAMMESLSEAVNFGRKGGLATEDILDVVSSGPMNCGLFQLKSDMIRKNDFPPQFPLKHMTKDLKFVVDTAYDVGAAVPVCLELLQLFRTGVGRGFGDEDFAGVMKVLQSMSDEGKS